MAIHTVLAEHCSAVPGCGLGSAYHSTSHVAAAITIHLLHYSSRLALLLVCGGHQYHHRWGMQCTDALYSGDGTVSTECYAPTARPPFFPPCSSCPCCHVTVLVAGGRECCNAAFLPTELMLAQSLTTLAVNSNGRLQSLIYTSSHPPLQVRWTVNWATRGTGSSSLCVRMTIDHSQSDRQAGGQAALLHAFRSGLLPVTHQNALE